MRYRHFHRLLAVLLCFALLLPNFASLAVAAPTAEARSVRTNSKWVPVSDPFASGEVPAYQTNGSVTPDALVMDCGNGVTNDGAKSYMKMVLNTSASETMTFILTLQNAGFTRTASQVRKADAAGNNNIFYRFLSPNKNFVLTVYYLHAYKEVRIIVDTAEDIVKDYSGGFVYVSETNESAQAAMVMYGLSMSPNGYDGPLTSTEYNSTGTRNCGTLMVIRMPDNSLFINDGGDIQQWNDEVCADFMKFCRELTGKSEGEKVVINSWFISHTHSDHYNGIPRFFVKYHDQIDIKNFMYNVDDERSGSTRDISPILDILTGYFPDATYYKPHTGEAFEIAGIKFDVLYTQEDRFAPDSDMSLNIGNLALKTSDGGTYRDFMYIDDTATTTKQTDYNDTSTVLRITFPASITGTKDVTSNFYADVNLGDQVIRTIWPAEMLANDIMMVPHHGHDPHPELVAASNSSIFLYTQRKIAIYGANGVPDKGVEPDGAYRKTLYNNFEAMNNQDANGDGKPDNYFSDTTATRKTYWGGTETACILFGENTKFDNMPSVLTYDLESPAGYTVYTAEAPFFPYEGWQIFETALGSDKVTVNGIQTTSKDIEFTRADTPIDNKRYLLMSDKYKYIMAYAAQVDATSNITGSLILDADGNSENTFYFGSSDESVVYIDNSDRDIGLWILQQYEEDTYGDFGFQKEQELGSLYNGKDASTYLGGTKAYMAYELLKGIGHTDTATKNGNYWYSVDGQDGSGTQYRWLHHRYVSEPFRNNQVMGTGNGNLDSDIKKYIMEKFDDGTFLIYYRYSSTDYRILTCDSLGNWYVKRYNTYETAAETKAAIKDDLATLKVRLYMYAASSPDRKVVGYTGSSTFDVLMGTTAESLATVIANDWKVYDPNHNNQHIPCSGTTPKVGYYWVDLSGYNASAAGTVTVPVYYRNDDFTVESGVATDTLMGSVTLNVVDHFDMLTAYNDDDTVYADTIYGSKYGFMYLDEGVIYEEVVNHTNRMDMTVTVYDAVSGVTTEVVSITPAMLRDRNGNAVNFNVPGEYNNLNLVYDGQTIGTGFHVLVAPTAQALSYPEAGNPGSVTVNKQGITIPSDFMATGIANIQLSATGVPEEKGVDLIIVMDLSGSMKNGLDTNVDAVLGEESRIEAMEDSLKSIVKELQGTGKDIRIAMSDFGDLDHFSFVNSVSTKSIRDHSYYDVNYNNNFNASFEFYNHLNWVIAEDDQEAGSFSIVQHKFNQGHSQYTGHIIPEIYTGSGTVSADAFVDVNSLSDSVMSGIVDKLDANVNKAIGTNYDIGLEYAYRLGYSIRKENQASGEDRDLVCIFLSDGAAMQYNYLSGRSESTTWADVLTGKPEDITSIGEYYADQSNWPEEIEQLSYAMLKLMTEDCDTPRDDHDKVYGNLLTDRWRSRYSREYFRYYPDKTRDTARYFYTYMDDQGYDLDWDLLYRIAVANGLEDHIGQAFTQKYYHNVDNVLQYLVDLLTTCNGTPVYKTDAEGNTIYKTDAQGNQVPVIDYYDSMLLNPEYRDQGRTQNQTDNRLPTAEYKYYQKYTGSIDSNRSYTDQFFEAMESIGVSCDWNLYARLIEQNKSRMEVYLPKPAREMLSDLIVKIKTPVAGYGDYQTLSPYDYFYNAEGKNWWAEAMKGDTDKLYPVINKYAFEDNPAWSNAYYGDVRNGFTTGTGLELDGKDYISGYQGLGMDLYTISFSISDDILLTTEVAETVLKNIASGPNYFYSANSQDKLTEVLKTITSSMSTAATGAWFTDTMGPDFDLSTEKTVMSHNGTLVTVNPNPSIRVLEYDQVMVTDEDGDVSYQRLGNPRVIETVTFEDLDGDGDVDAWSDLVYTTSVVDGVIVHNKVDIWDESTGLISAKNFYYNANSDKSVNIAFGTKGNYSLPAETFFWIIGVIGQTEMVLDYQVYLTGSIEGDRLLTSADYYHATNSNAVLHYVNYLGQNCNQDTVSPEYPWGDGKVGYAYYLVNKNGQMIANQSTGATTTDFAQAIKLTQPSYEYLQWNGDYSIASGTITAAQYRPDGLTLYSPSAGYSVSLAMDGSGSWSISDAKNSTYVANQGVYFSADQSYGAGAYLTGQTVVWFAVVIDEYATAPDAIVVDYGLPVDIDVLGNDDAHFANNGTLAALGGYSDNVEYSVVLKNGYAVGSYHGNQGMATIENNKIHYVLHSAQTNGVDQFNYAVYYTPAVYGDAGMTGYYYNSVTVIPATTIYYEDSFAQYHTYEYDSSSFKYVLSNQNKWSLAKDENYSSLQGSHQDEDRPGSLGMPQIDADNLYGFDSAYDNCSQYSMGSAMKFTADTTYAGTVTFTFYGTGFDVVSLTNSDTGTIMVDVYNADGYVQDKSMPIHSYSVDTYYGYTYDPANKEWIVTPGSDTLYQVPVMKVNGLDYGHYTAVITVAYADFFDHNKDDASYEFYMDAVRIYDPAGDNETAGDAYVQDGEFAPVYEELRNILLTERNFFDSTANLGDGYLPGAVFIDGIPVLNGDHYDKDFHLDPPEIGTYKNYGPNNEVYLASGQAIAFELKGTADLEAAHLAMKSTGGTAKIKVFPASGNVSTEELMQIATATDRYYDLTDLVGQTVIIVNVGSSSDGILSITNIKLTTAPNAANAVNVSDVFAISKRSVERALSALEPSENLPGTGDVSIDLMNSLVLLSCLCMTAIVVLLYMQRQTAKRCKKR